MSVQCDWKSAHLKTICSRLTSKAKARAKVDPDKLPVSPKLMKYIVRYTTLSASDPAATVVRKRLMLRNRSLFTLMYFALLRRSEVILLRRRDVKFQFVGGKDCAILTITSSKTDRDGRGQDVLV